MGLRTVPIVTNRRRLATNGTVMLIYLDNIKFGPEPRFKSDPRLQILFWMNFNLAAAGVKNRPAIRIQHLDKFNFGVRHFVRKDPTKHWAV